MKKQKINRYLAEQFRVFLNSLSKLSKYILIFLLFVTIARFLSIIVEVLPFDLADWCSEALAGGIFFVAIKEGIAENLSFKAILFWIIILSSIHILYKYIEEIYYGKQHGQ